MSLQAGLQLAAQHHHSLCGLLQTPEELKTPTGEEAFNADGLVQRSIRLLKDRFPDLEVGPSSKKHACMYGASLIPDIRPLHACAITLGDSCAYMVLMTSACRCTLTWRWTPTTQMGMTAL